MTDVAILVVRGLLLALTLWGGVILANRLVRARPASAFNTAWPCITGAAFVTAMGWLRDR